MTSYTVTYDLPTIKRGDTLDPWSVRAKGIVPVSVCAQLRDNSGKTVIPMPFTIGLDGTIAFEAISTKELKPQTYVYDIEWTMSDGRVRTYLEGTLKIEKDVSQCLE